MTSQPVEIEFTDLAGFEEPTIPCDIKGMSMSEFGLPDCKDDPAEWIGWRACPCGIKYRLVCDHCKTVYQQWQAQGADISCANCGGETGGFHDFTPLTKGS